MRAADTSDGTTSTKCGPARSKDGLVYASDRFTGGLYIMERTA